MIRQHSPPLVSGALLLWNCVLCLKDKLNAKKLKHSLYGHPHSKQCKANPITVDRTSFWNMHSCFKGYLYEYKKHQFNLLTCKCCQPENISPPQWGKRKGFFCGVLMIICCYFCFTCHFFPSLYGNNHNNLIWFVRPNKWECGESALNSDLRKRKSHCFFPSFAPHQPGNLTWPITVWGGLSPL